METPTDRRLIEVGGSCVIERDTHIQAALKGRRNLLLITLLMGQHAVGPGDN